MFVFVVVVVPVSPCRGDHKDNGEDEEDNDACRRDKIRCRTPVVVVLLVLLEREDDVLVPNVI